MENVARWEVKSVVKWDPGSLLNISIHCTFPNKILLLMLQFMRISRPPIQCDLIFHPCWTACTLVLKAFNEISVNISLLLRHHSYIIVLSRISHFTYFPRIFSSLWNIQSFNPLVFTLSMLGHSTWRCWLLTITAVPFWLWNIFVFILPYRTRKATKASLGCALPAIFSSKLKSIVFLFVLVISDSTLPHIECTKFLNKSCSLCLCHGCFISQYDVI